MNRLAVIFCTALVGLFLLVSLVRMTPSTQQYSSMEEASVPTVTVPQPDPVPAAKTNPIEAPNKQVKKLVLSSNQVMYLLGPVDDGVNEIIKFIDESNTKPTPSELYLLIDSPGGSVFDGLKLISAMEASKKPIHTVVLSEAASMAAVIESYGVKRYMTDRSTIMFHDASGALQGPVPQMQSRLNYIIKVTEKLDAYIANRAKTDFKGFLNRLHTEVWIDAEDAVAAGFADEIAYVYVANKQTINPFMSNNTSRKLILNDGE